MQDNYFYDNFAASIRPKRRILVIAGICAAAVFGAFYFSAIAPPVGFPSDAIITVENGATLSSEAKNLREEGIIKSEFLFKAISAIFYGRKGMKSGDYYFKAPANLFAVADRIGKAKYELEPVKITVPEGTSASEIGKILADNIPNFDQKKFVALAKLQEGYLFPDTYLFLPNIKPEQVVAQMNKNFLAQIAGIQDKISAFGKPIRDIIIMASIVEEEARTMETRQIIAGILWKRLKINMPLQVDSVFPYINGKNTFQLTTEDLAVESPYNTYIHTGLPSGPITNPGLQAILAAITPVATKYFYYLSDKNGNMHYAITHDGHLANKEKYLK